MFKNNYNHCRLTALPIAALLTIGSFSAAADDGPYYDIYGNVHVSINNQDSADGAELRSNTSSFGVKGGHKIGDGIEVIFKLEWQVDATTRNTDTAVVDRDQWVGFKGSFGKVLFGTASSNYKSKGGKVDPMYRTALEGRSAFMATQSRRLHAGAGIDRGRMTKSLHYATPKFNNFQVVANTTLSGSDDESSGVGVRHTTKESLFFVDVINDGDVGGTSESASKVGGYYKFGDLQIGGQFESSEDIDGSDYWFIGGSYKLSKTDSFKFSAGAADGAQESSSIALMYDHKMGKKTNIYIGYGSKDDDLSDDDSIFTVGARYKF